CTCTRDLDVSAGGSPARCTSRCAERGITEFLIDALSVITLHEGGYHAEEGLHRPDHHRARQRNREDQGHRGRGLGVVGYPERRHPGSDRRVVVCREQRRGAAVHSTVAPPSFCVVSLRASPAVAQSTKSTCTLCGMRPAS